ncbi:hypothetical protein [Gallaecimonas xiamenensis]|uniref:Copper export protein n=1 Tax=Gallaecimonas xiamenensis 3-C-1 TaxID=745411 RepID=K2JW75_9GAMM|nr:hypothetical protein [Gallaecimonas xiamenensis]EKE69485.1 hypothetical protein B3C1_15277 [Gallaecimonas xiamenensis 3-C-1]
MYYYILTLHFIGALLLAGMPLLSLLALLPSGIRKGEWQPMADFAVAFERLAWPLFLLMLGSGAALTWVNSTNVRDLWTLGSQAGQVLLGKTLGTTGFALLWWGWRYQVVPRLGRWRLSWVVGYLLMLSMVALALSEWGILYMAGFFLSEGQGI